MSFAAALMITVLIVVLASLGVGLFAMIMEHQRKMAEIRRGSVAGDDRLASLERHIAELTDLVHRQTIALDSLCTPAKTEERLEQRIGG